MAAKANGLVVALALSALFSCADHITESRTSGDDLPPTGRRIPASVQVIFDGSCARSGCHADLQRPLLNADVAFDQLVGVRSAEAPDLHLVEPGDPSRSYLYWKITGASGIVGARMPREGAPLSAAQIDTIRVWIENGAHPE